MNRHLVLTGALTGTILFAGIVSANASEITGTLQAGAGTSSTISGTVTGGSNNDSGNNTNNNGNSGGTTGNTANAGGGNTGSSGGGGTYYYGTGSSSSGSSASASATSTSRMANTTQAACQTMTRPMRMGLNNDPSEVALLQQSLNKLMNASLSVTGTFDQATQDAVKAFQTAHASDILAPWGLTSPTGYVYLTTLKKLNELDCGVPQALSAADMSAIAAYRSGMNQASASKTPSLSVKIGVKQAQAADVGASAGTVPTPSAPNAGRNQDPLVGMGASSNQTADASQSAGSFWDWISSSVKKLFAR